MNSWTLISIILLLAIIIFSPIFGPAEFLTYDDDWYIYENPNVINFSWDSIKNMFTHTLGGQYSPLGELYHNIIYSIFGKNVTIFKTFSLIIHLLNTCLLFHVLERIFKNKLLSFVTTLFFAIHPTQIEVVGWLSVIYRNAVTFMLSGYLFYIKYYNTGFKIKRLIPVIFCYLLAFLTKEQAILFPAGIFLIHLSKSKKVFSKQFIYEMIFWSILGLILGLITVQITKSGDGPSIISYKVPFLENLSLLAKSIIHYLKHFILPYDLSFYYPYPSKSNPISYLYLIYIIPIIGIGTIFAIKNKTIRFGVLWALFFLSLGLSFSFLHMRESFMADRYSYLSNIGFTIILFELTRIIAQKFSFKKIIIPTITTIYVILLGILSFQRVYTFNNTHRIGTQAIAVNPNNPFAHNSVGVYLKKIKKPDSALFHYKKALDLAPNYFLAHNNISTIYTEKKQYRKALFHVSRAIELNPKFYTALKNRVIIFKKINRIDAQLIDLNNLIKIYPDDRVLLQERSLAYFKLKKYDLAKKDALTALAIDDTSPITNYIIGHISLILNDFKNADIFLTRAIAGNSKKANYFFYRSVARSKLNNYKNALKDALMAKKLGFKVNNNYLSILLKSSKQNI